MVSAKSLIGLAALVVLSISVSPSAATIGLGGGEGGISAITNICGSYYGNFGLSLGNELQSAVNIVENVFQAAFNFVGGVANSILSIFGLGGGVGGFGGATFDNFLRVPTNKGSLIDLCLKLSLVLQPLLDRAIPGLGEHYLKAIYAAITLSVSAGGNSYEGLTLVKPLEGGLSDWSEKLNLNGLQSDWKSFYGKYNGQYDGAAGVLLNWVNSIFGLLETKLDVAETIVGDALCYVYGVFGLFGNMLNGALESVFDIFFEWQSNFFGGNYGHYRTQFTNDCGQYGTSSYNVVFKN